MGRKKDRCPVGWQQKTELIRTVDSSHEMTYHYRLWFGYVEMKYTNSLGVHIALVGAIRLEKNKMPRQQPRVDIWSNGVYLDTEDKLNYSISDREYPALQEGAYALIHISVLLNEARLSAIPCCNTCVYGEFAPELCSECGEGICQRYPYKEGEEIHVFGSHYCGEYTPKNKPYP